MSRYHTLGQSSLWSARAHLLRAKLFADIGAIDLAAERLAKSARAYRRYRRLSGFGGWFGQYTEARLASLRQAYADAWLRGA